MPAQSSILNRQSPIVDGKAVVVPDPDLPTIRQALEQQRDLSIALEERFEQDRLPIFLRMGLECVKAHALFAVPDAAARGAMGGRGKSSSTVEELSEVTSFDGWLAAEVRWLSVGSAYRYRRAALGLGLTHESTPEDLATLLQAAREEAGAKPLSLNQLVNRVPLTLTAPEEDPNTPEDKAGEARTQVADWITRWDRHEKAGGLEDADIPTLKQLDEFLSNTLQRIRLRLKSAAK